MRDNGNTGPALGSEAVDAQFWALICDDEEWLRTEFGGIVSEPAEHPTSPPPATASPSTRTGPPGPGGGPTAPVTPRRGSAGGVRAGPRGTNVHRPARWQGRHCPERHS